MDKLIRELRNRYPDIRWELVEPNDDILKTYGNGTILSGTRDGETKDFFILERDKKKILWGHVIANHLYGTVEGE